jgi:hypothetical protein
MMILETPMALTWDETVDLLKVVTAKDRRTIGEGDIQLWLAVAGRAGWPSLSFAIAAVVEHTNDAPGVWLEPGHITAYWRKIKSRAFENWSPPAPPPEMIDDEAASHRYAAADYQAHLDRAVEAFTRAGASAVAQLEARR